jgi:hypothetical protein
MRTFVILALTFLLSTVAAAQEPTKELTLPLTPKDLAAGWIMLFDGETPYAWTSDLEENKQRRPVDLKVDGGDLVVGALKNKGVQRASVPACFNNFELSLEYRVETRGEVKANLVLYRGDQLASTHEFNRTDNTLPDWTTLYLKVIHDPATKSLILYEGHGIGDLGKAKGSKRKIDAIAGPPTLRLETGLGTRLSVRKMKMRPLEMKSLFNGKDLAGWREFPGKKSKFTVNDKAELNVKDGPGDLQTEAAYGDFVLQLECISHGKHLNSGVFFRCRPAEYQQGYEAQIRNEFTKEATQEYKLDDYFEGKFLGKKIVKSPAIDHGTGGIQYRCPARKQMSKDGEWFAMTVFAQGKHLATWVNGVQVADFIDHRPPADNARKGYRAEPGPISLQGHDATTNLSFRNLRIAVLGNDR